MQVNFRMMFDGMRKRKTELKIRLACFGLVWLGFMAY